MSNQLSGTWSLLRLNLRLDRIRLTAWVAVFFIVVWASVDALQSTFSDPQSLQARAALGANPAAIMMAGPLFTPNNYTFGAMVANELTLWVLLPTAIMAVLFMVRHTRADEESGRLEMLRALPYGRLASPVASLLLVSLASIAVGVAVSAGLLIPGMKPADSIAFGLAVCVTGWVFGSLTAVAAQLSSSARTVTGMGVSTIIVAFLIRGVGDVMNPQGSWLSWFSPFAWAQQTRLYVDLRWSPLLVSVVITLAFTVLALWLASRRDLGAGAGHDRRGPAGAPTRLLSPAGVAIRLESTTFLTWSVGLFFFAVAFGSLASELEGLLDNMPSLGEWVEINVANMTASFGSLILSYLSLGAAVLLTASLMRLRTEEREGRLSALLISGSSRPRLVMSWLVVAVVEATTVLLLLGFGLGLGISLGTGETSWVGDIMLASLAYLPAVLLFGALAFCLFSLLPRLAGLTWVFLAWTALVLFLGELLGLPDWARGLSPIWHTPLVPEAKLNATPLLIMTTASAVLIIIGLLGFSRRDIAED